MTDTTMTSIAALNAGTHPHRVPSNDRTSPKDDDVWMTPHETAEFTKLSRALFARMRTERRGPRYFRVGHSIRYRKSDLLAWMAAGQTETVDTRVA